MINSEKGEFDPMTDIYSKLRERLDEIATGYPATESGVEIRILKQLFNEEEAEFFLQMSPLVETPDAVAERTGRDVEKLKVLMESMAKKGLLFRLRKNDLLRYAAIPYVVGIFEFQLKTMGEEFARDNLEYFDDAFGPTIQSSDTPVMRTIPIQRRIVADWPVAPYEDALEIIENQKTIAIADCVCRTMTRKAGQGCEKPLEACFVFGSHADYYVENKMARYINTEEAKEIIINNEKAGLVIQPFNARNVGGMCSCCGCCCGVLKSLKKQPSPAAAVKSNYFARVDDDECIGCETCLERCQMDAIDMVDDIATIDLDRCIGCGLCVTTCPTEAMSLIKKSEDHLYTPPKSGFETYINIARERGKI